MGKGNIFRDVAIAGCLRSQISMIHRVNGFLFLKFSPLHPDLESVEIQQRKSKIIEISSHVHAQNNHVKT